VVVRGTTIPGTRAAYRNNNRWDNVNDNNGFRLSWASYDSAWSGQQTCACAILLWGNDERGHYTLNQRGCIPAEAGGGVRDIVTASEIAKQARVGRRAA